MSGHVTDARILTKTSQNGSPKAPPSCVPPTDTPTGTWAQLSAASASSRGWRSHLSICSAVPWMRSGMVGRDAEGAEADWELEFVLTASLTLFLPWLPEF